MKSQANLCIGNSKDIADVQGGLDSHCLHVMLEFLQYCSYVVFEKIKKSKRKNALMSFVVSESPDITLHSHAARSSLFYMLSTVFIVSVSRQCRFCSDYVNANIWYKGPLSTSFLGKNEENIFSDILTITHVLMFNMVKIDIRNSILISDKTP